MRKKVVIVGIGNPDRGDDGAGMEVAARIKDSLPDNVAVVEAGTTPENFLGRIVACRPAEIYLVDTADFGGQPGDIRICNPSELGPGGLSSHSGSLCLAAGYLELESGGRVSLLAIQPDKFPTGDQISPSTARGIAKAVAFLEEVCTKQA